MVADLRAESDELDALVAELARRAVGRSHTRAGMDDRPPDRAPAVDRPRRADRRHRRSRASPACWKPRRPTRPGSSTRAPRSSRPPRPVRLLADWRSTRARLHDELLAVADGRKLPWFGPPMSAASMATARLMETWAHGLDVADALGVTRPATARLRSIAHIGVRTRDFAFADQRADPAGGSVPRGAARTRRLDVVVGSRTTPRNGSPARRRTSACWSRSAGRGRRWT